MGAVFGSLTSLSIGLSDLFARRVVSRRGALIASLVIQAVGVVVSLLTLLVLSGELVAADIVVGIASGVGIGIGLWGYLSGLGVSSPVIVAPIVATFSAVIPFGYAITRGADASAWAVVGATVAIGGLVLITAAGGRAVNVAAGVRWSITSGLGYGFGLSIIIEASERSGAWPAVGQRVGALCFVAVVAWRTGAEFGLIGVRVAGAAAGTFAALSTVWYLLGVQADPTPAVVTASMFPAVTVVIGRLVYRDVVTRLQVLGIVVVLAGVVGVVAL